jgi:hypothetical protein
MPLRRVPTRWTLGRNGVCDRRIVGNQDRGAHLAVHLGHDQRCSWYGGAVEPGQATQGCVIAGRGRPFAHEPLAIGMSVRQLIDKPGELL